MGISLEKHKIAYGVDSLVRFNDIIREVRNAPISLGYLARWLLRNDKFDEKGIIELLDRNEISKEFDPLLFKYLVAENIVRVGLDDQMWRDMSSSYSKSQGDVSKFLPLLSEKGIAT
jgi:hypothetical protein